MKRSLSALAILLLLVSAVPADAARRRIVQRPPLPALPEARMDALAGAALAGGVPGVSIAVESGDARIAKGYGRSAGDAKSITPDTIFQIASVTKQFTAAAVLALEEEGKLSVTDPVTRWIPELDLGGRTVTLHHLLTHTSGLRTETEFLLDPYAPAAQADVIRLIGSRGFATEPGTAAAYNNAGYWLLGVVIERITGTTYASFLEQRFFVPLSMTRTAYCGTGPAVPVPTGSYELFGLVTPARPIDMSIAFAAGALCSTAGDLVTWSRALASGQAISPPSYQKMTTPARLADGTVLDYGYGLGIGSIDGALATSHAGAIPGFQSYLIHIPSRRVTVAVLANANSSSRDWPREIARELARALLAGNDDALPKEGAIELTPRPLDS